jgi:hypothetical protein
MQESATMPFDWFLERLAKEWPMISQAPLTFVLITLVLGIILFILLRWQYRERLQQRDEIIAGYKEKLGLAPAARKRPATPLAVEEMNPAPHDPKSVASVRILSPCDRWHVGSHITIRGAVFPEGSSVQLLIKPWNDAWYAHNDVQVTGSAWSYNFGLKNHTRYQIVAVWGNVLKNSQYDEIPPHVVKSEIVGITQEPNQSDVIDCFDKHLHQTKIDDKDQIDDLVIVCGVRYQEHKEGNAPEHIEFVFCILNMSLIPVSVESVDGDITYFIDGEFYSAKLPPTLELKLNASNLGFRQPGWFKVQQDFKTEGEAKHLLNAPPDTTLFQFNALTIRVVGEDCSMILNTSNISFKKRDCQWLQREEIDFVLASLAGEQRRTLKSVNEPPPGVEFEISTTIRNSTVLLTDPGDTEDWRAAAAFQLEAKLFVRFFNDALEAARLYGLRLSIVNDSASKEWPLTFHLIPPNFRRPNAEENEYFQGLMVPGKELTDWYFFEFWLDVPKDCALSVDDNCYLRVSMDAGKQDTKTIDLRVPWRAARRGAVDVRNRDPNAEINSL